MTLNYIWWWGSYSGDLGNIKYPLLPLLPGLFWLAVVAAVKFTSMSQLDLFKSYSYLIKPWEKNGGYSRGVETNVLDCDILVSQFEL